MARVVLHLFMGGVAAGMALLTYPAMRKVAMLPLDDRTAQAQIAHVAFLLTAMVLLWPTAGEEQPSVPAWAALTVTSTMVLLWLLPFSGTFAPPMACAFSIGAGLASAVVVRRAP